MADFAIWAISPPGTFQKVMNDALREFLGWFVHVCIDYILVFTREPPSCANCVDSEPSDSINPWATSTVGQFVQICPAI